MKTVKAVKTVKTVKIVKTVKTLKNTQPIYFSFQKKAIYFVFYFSFQILKKDQQKTVKTVKTVKTLKTYKILNTKYKI